MRKINDSNHAIYMTNIISKTRQDIKVFLEALLLEEMSSQIHSKKYERNQKRRGYYNGFWKRKLLTHNLGRIEELKIPRSRESIQKLQTLRLYKRLGFNLNQEILRGYIFGLNNSNIEQIANDAFRTILDKSIISEHAHTIIHSIQDYRNRDITGKFVCMTLDTTWFVSVENKAGVIRPMFLCMGIDEGGRAEILNSQYAESDNLESWTNFISQLIKRGVDKDALELIVYGSSLDLKGVLEEFFPDTLKQRCLNTKMSSVFDHKNVTHTENRKVLSEELIEIFARNTKSDTYHDLIDFVQRWKDVEPRSSQFIKDNMDSILNYFSVSKGNQPFSRTTHLSQEIFHEISKKTNVIACYRSTINQKADHS